MAREATMLKDLIAGLLAGLVFVSGLAPAAIAQHVHGGAHEHGAAAGELAPSTREFMAINDWMHEAMNIEFTGDADVDFMRGMIPHHQAAVEMALVVLDHGTDPEVRALAEAIIAAQNDEIEMMQRWLAGR